MKAVFLSKKLVNETLSTEPQEGKRLLNPFSSIAEESGARISLLEVVNSVSRAEVHRASIDFFYVLEGEITFQTDGVLIDPFIRTYEDGTVNEMEIRAQRIEGGDAHTLTPGDMIWIPNGLTHSSRTDTQARLLVMKIPAPTSFPLENIKGWSA